MVGFEGVAAALASLTGVTVVVAVSVGVAVGVGVGVGVEVGVEVGVGVGVGVGVPDDELLGTRVSYSNCIVDPWTVSAFVESIRFVFVLVAAYCIAAETPLSASV